MRGLVCDNTHPSARLAGLKRVELTGGRPHLRAGALGERRNAADVIDVGVRDEDPRRTRAHAGELEPELGGIRPRDR